MCLLALRAGRHSILSSVKPKKFLLRAFSCIFDSFLLYCPCAGYGAGILADNGRRLALRLFKRRVKVLFRVPRPSWKGGMSMDAVTWAEIFQYTMVLISFAALLVAIGHKKK